MDEPTSTADDEGFSEIPTTVNPEIRSSSRKDGNIFGGTSALFQSRRTEREVPRESRSTSFPPEQSVVSFGSRKAPSFEALASSHQHTPVEVETKSSTQLFGKVAPFQQTSEAASLFGGSKSASTLFPTTETGEIASTLFRGSFTSSKDNPTLPSSSTNVFGGKNPFLGSCSKSEDAKESQQYSVTPSDAALFGGESKKLVFGKEVKKPTTLFGQPVEEAPTTDSTFSKASGVLFSGRNPVNIIFSSKVETVKDPKTEEQQHLPPPIEGESSFSSVRRSPQMLFGKPSSSKTKEKLPGELRKQKIPLASSEELGSVTSILCLEIPDEINHKKILKRHFSQFGEVIKVEASLRKKLAVVRFADHASAREAKENGTTIDGKTIHIFYSQKRTRKAEIQEEEMTKEEEPEKEDTANPFYLSSRRTWGSREPSPSAQRRAVSPEVVEDSQADLEELINQQALTNEDRYRILDARDKLMRLGSEGSSGKVMVGTCPDMCSEKERYMRVEKRQLAVYELQDGDVYDADHKMCVKAYARSSADQEQPLPHELRPLPALKLTMNYLLYHVIQLEEDNLADWYNFVWDRTRAIRKDITQQQLSTMEAAELVEKCIRFHIHCASRLCEEDVFTFDPSLNDENLFKAMKTLDEIYSDMAQDRVYSPNEPEFRAYEILLHLQHGDVHRVIGTVRGEVRHSEEVRLAVDIYLAFVHKNYVRFFQKIKKSATYLQACALHRFFDIARVASLKNLTHAFSLPTKTPQFPLSKLIQQLGFDTDEEAVQFVEKQGLSVSKECIVMERSITGAKTGPKRSNLLVEQKLTCPLPEVINKQPLEEDPLLSYQPYSSFTPAGYLKTEAYGNEMKEALLKEKKEAEELAKQREETLRVISEVATEVLENLLDECLQEETARACTSAQTDIQLDVISDGVVEELVDELIRDVSDKSLEASIREEEDEKLRKQLLFDMAATEVANTLISKEIDTIIKAVAVEEYTCAEKHLMKQNMHKYSQMVVKEVCEAILKEELHSIACRVFDSMKEERKAAMLSLRKKIELRLMKKYWRLWKAHASWLSKRRNAIEMLPAMPAQKTLKEQNKHLMIGKNYKGHSMQTMEKVKNYNSNLMDAHWRNKQLLEDMTRIPLPLARLVRGELDHPITSHLNWKMVLYMSRNVQDALCDRLRFKFGRNKAVNVDTLDLNEKASVSVCARITESRLPSHEELKGSSGFLYVIQDNQQLDWQEERRMLNNVVERVKEYEVSLQVWVFSSENKSTVVSSLGTIDHSVLVTHTASEPHIHLQGCEAVRWLCSQKFKDPHLIAKPLWVAAEDFLRKYVYYPIEEDLSIRIRAKLNHQKPDVLLSFYNSAVTHLVGVFNNQMFAKMDWPPSEMTHGLPPLHWNDTKFLGLLAHEIECLKLPEVPLHHVDTWTDVCDLVWNYITTVMYSDHSSVSLFSSVNRALDETKRQIEHLDAEGVFLDSEAVMEMLPWTRILQACINYKIDCIEVTDPVDGGELLVHYQENQMEAFNLPSEWLASTAASSRKAEAKQKSGRMKRRLEKSNESEHDQVLSRKSLRTGCIDKEEFRLLHDSVQQQIDANRRFEKTLLKLSEEDLDLSENPEGDLSLIVSAHNSRQGSGFRLASTLNEQLTGLEVTCQINRSIDRIFLRRLHDLDRDDEPYFV